MSTFTEKQRRCETAFINEGPYYHAYTSGKDTPIIFASKGDLAYAMNVIAQAAYLHRNIHVLAFEVMNNHFHFILSGDPENINQFWRHIFKRIKRYYPEITAATLAIKEIQDLTSLRNNIVYVNRNGYVANPNYSPFSYPWGTGRCYFLFGQAGIPVSRVRNHDLRKIFRCKNPDFPEGWLFINDSSDITSPSGTEWNIDLYPTFNFSEYFITPASYCAIRLGMSMFRDAHHYFHAVSKDVEAYSGLAAEIGDNDFLTDAELFAQLSKVLQERYGNPKVKDLTKAQKLDIARTLHYDFKSSNGQIRRILGFTQYEIDSLFPLRK
ncbi:MAG: hypothetical protein ACI3ZP_00120 [Candidatus Cryptobacteroides sp.]